MAEVESTGSLSTEKVTYRAYVKFETDAQNKTVVKEIKANAESAKKDKDTGLSANWAKLEKDGYTLFSENEFIRYNVKDEDGFKLLVPDPAQRAYIIQSGLNYLQNAKANSAMVEIDESTAEPTPKYSNTTYDLREDINEPPTRKSLTDLEKLQRLLKTLNLTEDQQAAMLLQLASTVGSTVEAEIAE